MPRQSQDEIRRFIRSGAVSKKINQEKQGRHVRRSIYYLEGRSYLLDEIDPQKLVDACHGTGFAPLGQSGAWKSKETVRVVFWVGKSLTDRFTIHYSQTGAHVVPSERSQTYEALGI